MRPGTLHFCRVNGKIRGTRAPQQTSAETMWIGSLGPRMFWGTRATNFSIYTTKMESAGPKILGTGAKFKRVPCPKKLTCKPGFDKQAPGWEPNFRRLSNGDLIQRLRVQLPPRPEGEGEMSPTG